MKEPEPSRRRFLARVVVALNAVAAMAVATAIGIMLPEDAEAVRAALESSKRRARRLKGVFLGEATSNG